MLESKKPKEEAKAVDPNKQEEAKAVEPKNDSNELEELKAKLAEETKAREVAESKLKAKPKKDKEEKPAFVTKGKEQRQMEQVDEIDQLRQAQLRGEIPMIEGNVKKEYSLPVTEQHLVHLLATVYIAKPGQKQNDEKSKVLKFDPLDFERKEKSGLSVNYDKISILHDPRDDKSISRHRESIAKLIENKSVNLKKQIE